MPPVEPSLTVKSLAEIAWFVSRVGRQLIELNAEPSPEALRSFWQNARKLQRHWDDQLNDPRLDSATDRQRVENLMAQQLITEMVARVWATVLAGIDLQTGRRDLTRVATNAVNGLQQIRHRLLSCLLDQPGDNIPAAWTADLDRLRRRCDRWTDLLIGHLCGSIDCFQFAIDGERARDFAEDSQLPDPCARPVDLLVAASVRLSFLGQLPDADLDPPEFAALVQSILGSIPEQAFDHSGILKTQRIPDSILGAPVDLDQDVLLPGVSLTSLRRRFS